MPLSKKFRKPRFLAGSIEKRNERKDYDNAMWKNRWIRTLEEAGLSRRTAVRLVKERKKVPELEKIIQSMKDHSALQVKHRISFYDRFEGRQFDAKSLFNSRAELKKLQAKPLTPKRQKKIEKLKQIQKRIRLWRHTPRAPGFEDF